MAKKIKRKTESKKKYKPTYHHPKWLTVRKKVFTRDKHKCLKCSSTSNLQCHHTYYVKGKKIWDYPLSCFETLCRKCHEEFHQKVKGSTLVRVKSEQKKLSTKEKHNRTIMKMVSKLSAVDKKLHERYSKSKSNPQTTQI